MIGNSDDETNFPLKLLLTNIQVTNLCKAFANYLSAGIKLSKTQLSKMIQSGRFLGRLVGPLLKTGLPLMKNVLQPLAKSVLLPSGLSAAALAADVGIHKKILGYGTHPSDLAQRAALIISNEEMEDIMKIVKSLEDSGLLLKGVSETKIGFLTMPLGTLGARLLGNMLAAKGINRAGDEIIRAGYGSKRSSKNKNF